MQDSKTSFIISLIVLVVLLAFIGRCAVDALVETVSIQHYSHPVEVTFEKPAAYRLTIPTADQMDHLDDVQQIAQVRR